MFKYKPKNNPNNKLFLNNGLDQPSLLSSGWINSLNKFDHELTASIALYEGDDVCEDFVIILRKIVIRSKYSSIEQTEGGGEGLEIILYQGICLWWFH